ncbi:probable peptidyl-tRNA hydrolase 2 [Rhinatrema bivittatum]|uniref:probable peptidyl-tRNA hydrolase 2 n=1 Tax=Rhinatrema bivittatum TaxID=194408 RepID=UPI00112E1B54|nr:probable peptidyl-tRNA hydrolase 2 [Rhinatrema bivittatum]
MSGMESCDQKACDAAPRSLDVNPEYMQQLKDLDIPEEEAKKALILTGNVSAEEAAIFYFDSLEDQNQEEEEEQSQYKMVFVVNMDLSMGVGKIAAQVGHAAVGLYQQMHMEPKHREMVFRWDEHGAKKVVLQGSSTAHLMELQALAMSLGLPSYIVQDAGRTQIAAGSHTVLSLMGEEEMVNKVTGKLKLLN